MKNRWLRSVCPLLMAVLMMTLFAACNKEDPNPDSKPTTYALDLEDAFTISLGADTKKMLMCAVVFEVTDEKAVESLTAEIFIVKAAVLKELLSLTLEEVYNADLTALEIRLTEVANEAMNTDVFYSASITKFTVA